MTTTLRAATLRCDVVYVTPRGLLCLLVPARLRGPGSGGEQYEFCYIGHAPNRAAEGFWLTLSNLRILRKGASV